MTFYFDKMVTQRSGDEKRKVRARFDLVIREESLVANLRCSSSITKIDMVSTINRAIRSRWKGKVINYRNELLR